MSRKKDQRQQKIRKILMDQEEAKVSDLAEMLQVTPETIRKDLDELESQNIVVREHGMASLRTMMTELPLKIRQQDYPDEKRRITMRALREIENGQIVFLDGGSTLLNGIQMLRSKKDLTIVTTYLPVGIECVEMGFETYIIGGQLHPSALYCNGPLTIEMLKNFHFDIALLGTTGLKGMNSFSLFSLDESAVFKEVAKRSDRVIVLMNREKIHERGLYPSMAFSEIPMLITNPLSAEERDYLKDVKTIIEV